jgi:hypothetical protein
MNLIEAKGPMAIFALCATNRERLIPLPRFSPTGESDGLDILTVFLTFKLPNESSVL